MGGVVHEWKEPTLTDAVERPRPRLSKTRAALVTLLVVIVLASSAFAIYSFTRKVTGISMLPTLEEGDLVVVQPISMAQVSVGDIIVYDPPCSAIGEAIIHRVVNIASDGFITRGDNNGQTDQSGGIARSPVTQSCLEGKVVFVIPYLEKLSELPYGMNYVLAALIVIFVLYTEVKSWRADGDGDMPPGKAGSSG